MRAGELKNLISQIVANEVKKQLPSIAQKVISEIFIKKIILEQMSHNFSSILRESEDEEEEFKEAIPEIQKSEHKGIYNESSTKDKFLKGNPLSFLYEGVDIVPQGPISNMPVDSRFGDEGVPLDTFKMDNVKKIAGIASSNKPQQNSTHDKLREIEEQRKRLEIPVEEFLKRNRM
jgi:Mg2+ and Co2+ transporter CorA